MYLRKYKMLKNIILITITILTLNGCANIQAPTGGAKDNNNPIVLFTDPINKSVNFKKNKITLDFNENIILNNINQEIEFIPNINNEFKINSYKKTVTIEFTKPLKEETTYRINFNKGIKDITEGNQLDNYSIIFSTGNKIDSLRISGKINDINNNKITDAVIGLFVSNDTLNIFKQKPYIYSNSIKGEYKIENIKEGKYEIIAFIDKNKNYLIDRNEKIGYKNESIQLNTNINNLDINIDNIKNTDSLKIISTYTTGNKLDIELNKGIKSVEINNNKIVKTLNNYKNKISIYSLINTKDSLEINLNIIDSTNNQVFKKIKFLPKEKVSKKEIANIIPSNNSKVILYKENINIKFSKPIKDLNKENLIKLYIDNNKYKNLVKNIDYTINDESDNIEIKTNFIAVDSFKIEIDKGTLYTINDDSVYSIKSKYLIIDNTEIGSIEGKIKSITDNIIIQLLDDKYNVVEEIKNKKEYKFINIRPGKYNIRVINDTNKNGLWDKGEYSKRTQSEEVRYYKEEITLKENWEIQDINLEI